MRCIIAGSRDIRDEQLVWSIIELCPFVDEIAIVLSGGQKSTDDKTGQNFGVDYFAERWADKKWLACERYPADWKRHGRAAGPIRNGVMAKNADSLIAIPCGESRGTRDMIRQATAAGLRVWVHEYYLKRLSD
jgi:hypothetical protein